MVPGIVLNKLAGGHWPHNLYALVPKLLEIKHFVGWRVTSAGPTTRPVSVHHDSIRLASELWPLLRITLGYKSITVTRVRKIDYDNLVSHQPQFVSDTPSLTER